MQQRILLCGVVPVLFLSKRSRTLHKGICVCWKYTQKQALASSDKYWDAQQIIPARAHPERFFQFGFLRLVDFSVWNQVFIYVWLISISCGFMLESPADILARLDGCHTAIRRLRLRSQIHFSCFQNSPVHRKTKNESQYFYPKLNYCHGLKGRRMRQNVPNDSGVISHFMEILTLRCDLLVKIHISPKLDFHFPWLNHLFSFIRHLWVALCS